VSATVAASASPPTIFFVPVNFISYFLSKDIELVLSRIENGGDKGFNPASY
jgi:hypothetical protein